MPYHHAVNDLGKLRTVRSFSPAQPISPHVINAEVQVLYISAYRIVETKITSAVWLTCSAVCCTDHT